MVSYLVRIHIEKHTNSIHLDKHSNSELRHVIVEMVLKKHNNPLVSFSCAMLGWFAK